ncbi:hypothetical protein ACFE04_006389 [Oxalis oulophora]
MVPSSSRDEIPAETIYRHDRIYALDNTKAGVEGLLDARIYKDASSLNEVMEKIGNACKNCGFFQVINQGVPITVLDGVTDGVRDFMSSTPRQKKISICGIRRRT